MYEQNNPIVVTGASGRVGGMVAKGLLKAGNKVRVVVRDINKVKSLKEQGAEIFESYFTDPTSLTKAFTNAKAVFILTPLTLLAKNLNAEQYDNVDGIIKAIKGSGVKNVVLLSSWGTELKEKSGGILGCRYFENELDKIPDLNTVFLRPVWFMENFIYNIGLIKISGINGLAIKPDVKFPMVDTHGIATIAIKYLQDLNFKNRNVQYISGPKEYSMQEVTAILGSSIGKPDMQYIEFPRSILKKGLIDSRQLSPDGADMLIEINQCISKGILKSEPRSKTNTTPTTLEEFAKTKFAPAYHAIKEASFSEKITGFFLKSFLSVAGKRLLKKEKLQPLIN